MPCPLAKSRPVMAIVLATACSCGCATKYRPYGPTGGYAEQSKAERTFEVTFRGNAWLSKRKIQNYVMTRCAELTIANGCDYFVLTDLYVSQSAEVFDSDYASLDALVASLLTEKPPLDKYPSAGLPPSNYPPAGQKITVKKYTAHATIQIYPGPMPLDQKNVFDARVILQTYGKSLIK